MGDKPVKSSSSIVSIADIQSMIFTIRGVQVMVDSDLATVYEVRAKVLNQAVKRNIDRFPESFRFQLTVEELENLKFQFGTSSQGEQNNTSRQHVLRSQFVTSSEHGGRRYLPYVFTEQGVAMLSAVLRSETAIEVSIQIINAFVAMRTFIRHNVNILTQLNSIVHRQIAFESITEKNFEKIFQELEASQSPKQGIFYNGQVYDAYTFVADLIRKAKKSLIIIDNYVEHSYD